MLRRPLHYDDEEEILGEHLKRKFTADFGFFCLNYQNVLSDLNVCTAMNMGSRISMGNSHFLDRVRSTNQFSVRRNSIWALLSVSRRPKGSDLHWHGWMAEGGMRKLTKEEEEMQVSPHNGRKHLSLGPETDPVRQMQKLEI